MPCFGLSLYDFMKVYRVFALFFTVLFYGPYSYRFRHCCSQFLFTQQQPASSSVALD